MTQDSLGSFFLSPQTFTPGTSNLSCSQLLGFTGKLSVPSKVRAPCEIKRAAEGEDKTCKWEVERKHIAKPGLKSSPRAYVSCGRGGLAFCPPC